MAEVRKLATAAGDEVPTITARKIRLSRTIETHGGPIKELTLNEPRADLVLKHGLPYRMIVSPDETGQPKAFEVEYIPAKMALYLEAMSGIDLISLGNMNASDMARCFEAVLGMLQSAKN